MKIYMEYKAIITYEVPKGMEFVSRTLASDDHKKLIDDAVKVIFEDFGGDIHSRVSRYRLVDEPVQDIEED